MRTITKQSLSINLDFVKIDVDVCTERKGVLLK